MKTDLRRGRARFAAAELWLGALESMYHTLPRAIQYGLFVSLRFVPSAIGLGLRYVALRNLSPSCGRLVAVFTGVYILHPENIVFGSNISIHPMSYLEGQGGIDIGNDVSIAHSVSILSTTHDYKSHALNIRDAPLIQAPISIGNNVWIGAGARILAGASIGNRCVVGAGAVVTGSIPDNSVAVGVPARVIRKVSAGDETTLTL